MLAEAKAVIWDMDGVIADTAPYHLKAWYEVFTPRGIDFNEAVFNRHFGQRNDTFLKEMLGPITPAEIAIIANEKEEYFRREAHPTVKPLPGAIELIKALDSQGYRQGIGSSAPLENIELIVRELDIARYFPVIVSGKDVREGKPSPQGFLLAAERLDVKPFNCVVIEDAVAGITAARRGGMHCIAVTNTVSRAKLSEADIVIDNLQRITVNDIASLLTNRIPTDTKKKRSSNKKHGTNTSTG